MNQSNSRSCHLGKFEGFDKGFSDEDLLQIWAEWSRNRAFEQCAAEALKSRHIKVPTYLSLGSEHIPVALKTVFQGFNVFAQHRAHSYYLSFGGSPVALIDELLGLPTGCTGGRGGSASIHDPGSKIWGHSGLMGDQVPIGVGYALASKEPTMLVMGDASAEEDYVLGALGYAATKSLPVIFVCEDNNLSILTKVETRRSWSITDVAASYGMQSFDISDDPRLIIRTAEKLKRNMPGLVNIRCCRDVWHAGAGTDGPPEWNQHEIFREILAGRGLDSDAELISVETKTHLEALWQERAQESLK